jgi:flagellin
MFQTFDGAMQEVNDSLARMKELTVQGANDHLSVTDRDAIQKELDENVKHIDYIAKNTEFNGIKLLDGNAGTKTSLIGAMSDQTIDISGCDLTKTGLSIDTILVDNSTNSGNAIDTIDQAIKKVSREREKYGGIQSRLEGTNELLDSKDIELQKAQSNIADADIAEEMIEISKDQVLMQASTSLMAQSNNFPLDALKILQNMR